ncbi:ABC-F family ATP-binding cassette domain-containing protein [Rubrimonas cliftonensis]|uniref:ATP-binding protein Uup n=1 Tax=Rubrimonas cliftonensis TaxID=89524 RepID=A0A1H3ZEW3_9RHOB|nr:ATP-binding cassette domain-containing protein [Rubrimonas cliftonensis]SEA22299.1 ATP-binding cassette, subfamily F, uup [Rubrimonas cliftonensis]
MAQPPILTLTDVSLTFGGAPLFSGASLSVGPGERVGVVGRNGSGKSTLLKIAAGLVEADSGGRFVQPGAKVAYLPQEPDLSGFDTLGAYVAAGVAPDEDWRAEMAMEGLAVRAEGPTAGASGGERRRAALARLIAGEPDLMLLDEPTNHLDIAAIEWLEEFLGDARTGFVLISHDRALMAKLTRATLWVDRGQVRRLDSGFAGFEAWRDKVFEDEEAERHKLDRLIKQEAKWAVEGISARRTRNQGRVRRLAALREERRSQVARTGVGAMALSGGETSGKLVAELKGVSKSFGDKTIVRDFSTRIARGDRVALVGPNGAGKTTLLKLITGELAPDSGTVRLGSNLDMALFDQNRAALDLDATLWETLTGAADIGVSGRNDQILVRGRPKHVVAYLKDFLFDERQARGPVKALSGGERARLLMAKLMARESNLLVLDEPTNDLDVETLDLLQELLGDFDGTVILVSHDRDFLDRVATSVIAWEGEGRWVEYAGGWSDHLAQKAGAAAPAPRQSAPTPAAKASAAKPGAAPASAVRPAPAEREKLNYAQTRRLDLLPAEIDRLGFEIGRLEQFLAQPDLFAKNPAAFDKATRELAARQKALASAEDEWLELESLREAAG